jgi:hypothetical protein
MSRRSTYTPGEIKNFKTMIRTGEPIISIAERIAPMYGKSVVAMCGILYKVARTTYKIAEWDGPKRRTNKVGALANTTSNTTMVLPTNSTITNLNSHVRTTKTNSGARIERYDDHIRIYF